MGDYDKLRAQLGTDDPYSPGNALSTIAKAWANWRMKQDAAADPAMPPVMSGAFGGIVRNPMHPDFQLLRSYVPKLADAMERTEGPIKYNVRTRNIRPRKGEITEGETAILSDNTRWPKMSDPVQVDIQPGLDEIARLGSNIHEGLHTLYFHRPDLKSDRTLSWEQRGIPTQEQGEQIVNYNGNPRSLGEKRIPNVEDADFYGKDYAHNAIEWMTKNIMSRLLFPKGQ